MTHLFVYGSLMFEPVWHRLVNTKFRKTEARLPGYRRHKIRDQVYPGIIKGQGHVDGIVYLDLDDKTMRRLDEFEEECYQRATVLVIDTNGRELQVDTYIVQNDYRFLLEEAEWDPDEFERTGLQRFISGYHGFDADEEKRRETGNKNNS